VAELRAAGLLDNRPSPEAGSLLETEDEEADAEDQSEMFG
jgi:hypothetical protein